MAPYSGRAAVFYAQQVGSVYLRNLKHMFIVFKGKQIILTYERKIETGSVQSKCCCTCTCYIHTTFYRIFLLHVFFLTRAAEEVSAQQEHYVIYYPHDEQGTPSAQALSLHIIVCR